MAKNAPFHIKSPVKNVHGRAKGGASHRAPPKYATLSIFKKAEIMSNNRLHRILAKLHARHGCIYTLHYFRVQPNRLRKPDL